jgi:Baseplate J-like protein
MPIPLPNLDDIRWADLVEEGRSSIPVHSPEWTNFNASDPGITLMELFAFIAEMDIYQLNRISHRSKRKFLQLAGLHPTPPMPSRVVLRFALASGEQPMPVPAGNEYEFGTAKLPFRTLDALTVMPGTVTIVPAPDALYLGFTDALPRGATVQLFATLGSGQRSPIEARWEYFNQQGWWSRLGVVDSTCGFVRDGVVWIEGPPAMLRTLVGKTMTPLYYVRIRGANGVPPTVKSMFLNAMMAEQSQRSDTVTVGKGTGAPWQRVDLPDAPVLDDPFVLESAEPGGMVRWQMRSSLDGSSPGDPHFVLDAQAGMVTFGDGRRGRVLPSGAVLNASYTKTRAGAGTLAAGEIAANTGNLTVTAVTLAMGGADAETLGHALARLAAEREAPSRAVTLADFEALAKSTPGVDLARVTALANVHPAFDCIKAFGVVTVLVVPNVPGPAPTPDQRVREMIRAHLDERRTIGTRVEVTGPVYLQVAVRAKVQSYAGQNPARVRDAITAAINQLFDPLTGGAEGNGWPFGRDIYRAEVMQTIMKAPGVSHVLSMDLIPAECAPECGNICLKPTWLVTPGEHSIEVL